jgi:hypothetical protein
LKETRHETKNDRKYCILLLAAASASMAEDLQAAYQQSAAASPVIAQARAQLDADLAGKPMARAALLPHINAGASGGMNTAYVPPDLCTAVEDTLRVKRIPRVITIYQFVLAMVLAIYIGFSRLNHIRFVANDPMLTGVLKVASLQGQSVFWRFSASLHLSVAQQLMRLQRVL